MHYGALLPIRLGERIDKHGRLTYDAITHVYFVANRAMASGLTDNLKPSHGRELARKLHSYGVTRFSYFSKGEFVDWKVYEKNGRIRAKVINVSR